LGLVAHEEEDAVGLWERAGYRQDEQIARFVKNLCHKEARATENGRAPIDALSDGLAVPMWVGCARSMAEDCG
jgi:hypothetical protein